VDNNTAKIISIAHHLLLMVVFHAAAAAAAAAVLIVLLYCKLCAQLNSSSDSGVD
jgi:hypothetical protein